MDFARPNACLHLAALLLKRWERVAQSCRKWVNSKRGTLGVPPRVGRIATFCQLDERAIAVPRLAQTDP